MLRASCVTFVRTLVLSMLDSNAIKYSFFIIKNALCLGPGKMLFFQCVLDMISLMCMCRRGAVQVHRKTRTIILHIVLSKYFSPTNSLCKKYKTSKIIFFFIKTYLIAYIFYLLCGSGSRFFKAPSC